MPVFSANFRAALASGEKFVPFVSIAWPSGTKRYGVSPRAIGGHPLEPRLLSGGTVSSAIPLTPGGLSFPEASFNFADADGEITRLLEASGEPRGVACAAVWGMASLLEVDWYTLFGGILDRAESGEGGYSKTLFARANDRPLQGNADKATFLPAEFPKAPPATWNTFFPRIYGSMSALNLSTTACMVPCIPWSIDAGEGYRYTPTMGHALSVPRVRKNGTLLTLGGGADYTLSYPIRGKLFTSIDMVAATTVTDIITCDIDGLESVGDGTGVLISNPVDQLKHFLANFGFGDWRYGPAWNDPEAYPIDLASFARATSFASAFLPPGSMRFGGGAQPQALNDMLQSWFNSWPCFRPYWSERGQLALGVLEHRFHGVGSPGFTSDVDAVFVRGQAQEIGVSFEDSEDTSNLINRVDLEALFGLDADGKTRKAYQNISVQDVSQEDAGAQSYALQYSLAVLV